jgi:tryptophan synthase alpha chain
MSASNRIARAFAARHPLLVSYLTAGFPSPARTVELALALERGGTGLLELGVPFSDPVADGPVIQRASDAALKAGTTLAGIIEIARQIRAQSAMPIVLFSYINPLLRYGFERLCADAVAAGIDGMLITDLSVEEAGEKVRAIHAAGLDTVFLTAPTSTKRRLALAAEQSSGFVYVVSRAGVTGEQTSVAHGVDTLVGELRGLTQLPLAVGFGVSRREHFEEIGRYADGVIVGSAIMHLIERHADAPDLPARLEQFCKELTAIR